MESGYVYILSNPSMPGLIKIGHTKRSPEERARELSRNTSIPLHFIVEFEIFSVDRIMLESIVHRTLEPYRINKKREFFEIALDEAIEIVRLKAEIINKQVIEFEQIVNKTPIDYESIEILEKLKQKFPQMIRKEIKSVRIYQTNLRCYLEISEEKIYDDSREVLLVDQLIRRQDLGYIIDEGDLDKLYFNPEISVYENARKFIKEFDPYSTLVTCSDLFTDEGSDIIQNTHFSK